MIELIYNTLFVKRSTRELKEGAINLPWDKPLKDIDFIVDEGDGWYRARAKFIYGKDEPWTRRSNVVWFNLETRQTKIMD